jgi:hypothetical protein
MRLRIALSVVAVTVLLSAPALGTEGLPEVLSVGPNAKATGEASLKLGVPYKLDVSGTMDFRFTHPDHPDITYTQSLDAFYCFASSRAGGECTGATNDQTSHIYMRSSGDDASINLGYQLPQFLAPRGFSPPFAASHQYSVVMVPHKDGVVSASTKPFCERPENACSGPGFRLEVSDLCQPPQTATASAINELRVVSVEHSAAVHRAGAPDDEWCELEKDDVLKQGDEISCDPDGSVTVQFADNSTFTVRNTTQLKVASFFTEGGVVRVEILLKMGEVAAKVNKSEATKSDFRIKSPTAGAAPRGTKFSVFYDPGSKATLTSTTEGVVEVDPVRAGLKNVLVRAGRQVEVTARSMTKVTAIGKAGARGGINRITARNRVLARIAKANDPCHVTTPRASAYSITPARGGWAVSIKVIGKLKGTSKWTVIRGRVRATNALARRLVKGCA